MARHDFVLGLERAGARWRHAANANKKKKRIEYAEITMQGLYLNGPMQGERIKMELAVTVFDNDTPTTVNRDELEWHRKHGAEILMPSNAGVER